MTRTWIVPMLLATVLAAGCTGPGSGLRLDVPVTLEVTSPTVQPGQPIPAQHTCDGTGSSPQIDITNLPPGTATAALIVQDPDAPGGTFFHWLIWDIPASGPSVTIGEGQVPGQAIEGENSAGGAGYTGPCPPSGDGDHRYTFVAYAVDARTELDQGAGVEDLLDALEGRALAQGSLTGTYTR